MQKVAGGLRYGANVVRRSAAEKTAAERRTTFSRDPVRLRADGGAEPGEQFRGVGQVVQVNDLHRAVHVAVGDADEAGRYSLAADLDGVGVGAGGAGHAAHLHGDLVGFRRLFEQVEDARVDVRPAEE